MAIRLGSSLFLGGAAVTVAVTLLPHPEQVATGGFWALAAVQLAVALGLLLLPSRLTATGLPWIVVIAGVLAVTAAIYLNGERHGGPPLFNELFYVWPALYAGYFFGRRRLAAALAVIAAAYAATLVMIALPMEAALMRWCVTVSVVCGVAGAASALRRHVDRLLQRLREAMRTDLLTEVLNRRGFEEAFGVELQRVARTGRPLCVLIGDVDRFKVLNDRFGHAAGDAALAAVAGALREGCRSVDVIARIGGEEFAILMPAAGLAHGCATADRLRAAVASLHDPAGEPLSISFGVTECPSSAHADPDRLLREADGALYAAKAAGRDRTVAAERFAA